MLLCTDGPMLLKLKASCCVAKSPDVQYSSLDLHLVHQPFCEFSPASCGRIPVKMHVLHDLTQLSFAGDQSQQYVIDFDEKSGPDPLGDMLMKVSGLPLPLS